MSWTLRGGERGEATDEDRGSTTGRSHRGLEDSEAPARPGGVPSGQDRSAARGVVGGSVARASSVPQDPRTHCQAIIVLGFRVRALPRGRSSLPRPMR